MNNFLSDIGTLTLILVGCAAVFGAISVINMIYETHRRVEEIYCKSLGNKK